MNKALGLEPVLVSLKLSFVLFPMNCRLILVLVSCEEVEHLKPPSNEEALGWLSQLLQNEVGWTSPKPGEDQFLRIVIFARYDFQLEYLAERFFELYKELFLTRSTYERLRYFKTTMDKSQASEWPIASFCMTCGCVVSIGKRIPGLPRLELDDASRCWCCWLKKF